MLGTYHVRARHLECVEDDHNKYYRTYVISETGSSEPNVFLVRNWGKRGAPTGQWLRDEQSGWWAPRKADYLCDEKLAKGYWSVHTTDFTIPTAVAEGLKKAKRRSLPETECSQLGDSFDGQWCQDLLTQELETDPVGGDMFVWVPQWQTSLHDRKPARMLVEQNGLAPLHVETQRQVGVYKTDEQIAKALQAAFDKAEIHPARTGDGVDFLVVACRLWNPESSGPYQHLTNAMRDARRIFRRPNTEQP